MTRGDVTSFKILVATIVACNSKPFALLNGCVETDTVKPLRNNDNNKNNINNDDYNVLLRLTMALFVVILRSTAHMKMKCNAISLKNEMK